MAVTLAKGEGVTVFTMASNPKSVWPPLCQILGNCCYSPVCCSVSQGLRRFLGSLSALGTIQIMVGLFTIGFGLIRLICRDDSSFLLRVITPPYMFGSLFIGFGILCILSGKYPSPCLVGINVLVNLVGVALAITAIVTYAIDLANIDNAMWYWCRRNDDYDYWRRRDYSTTAIPSLDILTKRRSYKEKCMETKRITAMLLRGLDVFLIVLAALQLCVTISAVVLGIKALKKARQEGTQSIEDPEACQTLVQE